MLPSCQSLFHPLKNMISYCLIFAFSTQRKTQKLSVTSLQSKMATNSSKLVMFPTRSNSSLLKLIVNTDTAANQARIVLKWAIWHTSASQKIRLSSTKKRRDTIIPLFSGDISHSSLYHTAPNFHYNNKKHWRKRISLM